MCREDGSLFRLGQGKTSSSYKALDLDLRSPVVLKVIRPEFLEDETAKKRFLREARAAALLRHPNVATIYRLGEEDGACFYAREFIDGETLEAKVTRDGPLELKQALDVVLQAAQALVAVKTMNLVHRDIKPSNLMLTPQGVLKIIDFGLTKISASGQTDGMEMITLAGFVGTPDYASPEQLNESTVDVSSDIYSLGVTLWYLLTGRPPFRGPMAQVMASHLQSPPPFEELSAFPPGVVSLLAHMLEKNPADRPVTPAQLVEEIEKCQSLLKGDAPHLAPSSFKGPAVAPIAPQLPKMTAARMPAPERKPRQFLFAEVLIGAAIALIVYLILTRPVSGTDPAGAAEEAPSSVQSTVAPVAQTNQPDPLHPDKP